MTTTTLGRIATQTATLPVADRVPPDQLGYGLDLSCVTDTTVDLAEVDPMSNTAVGESIVRRLITPRGGVLDDQAYGLDLRAYCNKGVTTATIRNLSALIRSEAMKDDRVIDATAVVTWEAVAGVLNINLQLRTESSTNGVFTLVFFVTATGAELVESIDS